MESDQEKWDARYGGTDFFLGRKPSSFLVEKLELITRLTAGRNALDIACGEGRNSIFLARNGFRVTGADISPAGLAKARGWAEAEGLSIDFRCVNLQQQVLDGQYNLIINFNFLLRPLLRRAYDILAPDGVLVVDTILDSPYVPSPHQKEFLLRPGELLTTFSALDGVILHFEERLFAEPATAKILFWKRQY